MPVTDLLEDEAVWRSWSCWFLVARRARLLRSQSSLSRSTFRGRGIACQNPASLFWFCPSCAAQTMYFHGLHYWSL